MRRRRSVTAYFPDPVRKHPEPGVLNWINLEGDDRPAFAGRDVLLCFFSSSSVPCLQTLRLLNELLPAYGSELLVAGVCSPRFDRERDAQNVRRAIARLSVRMPVLHDRSGDLRRDYAVDTLPTLVSLRADGAFSRHVGEPDVRRLRSVLEELRANAVADTGPVRILSPGVGPPAPLAPPMFHGALRFPTVIKPLPGTGQRWAVADCGHHQIVLLDDAGVEQARFGAGVPGHRDGSAAQACFYSPHGLVCSTDAIYVADTGNHAIRRIDVTEQRVTTVAGTGRRGYGLPREPRDALSSALSSPWDLELDGGSVYFTNAGSHQLGVYSCMDDSVRRLAGTGEAGRQDGPAGRARLSQPAHLALEESGDRLFFTDSDSGLVRSLTLDETACVQTLVGREREGEEGAKSRSSDLQYPLGVAWVDGLLLVADCYNDRIMQVAVGEGGGATIDTPPWAERLAPLCEPMGIYAEDAERVLLVDTNNHRIVHYLAGPGGAVEQWPR